MTSYIDPNTELPQHLGEIYSDRNIRIVGQARINPLNSNQVETLGVQVLCTPSSGGAESISSIPNGTYTLGGVGASLWVKLTRSGTATVTPEIYPAGSQPKSRRDYVQVFYKSAAGQIVSISSFLIYAGPLYTKLGYGVGQRVYNAIVGEVGDEHATHTDLQSAISDTPDDGSILIKKLCPVATTITTGNKRIKFCFNGYGTGLQSAGASTGISFGKIGCQLVGFGTITGFTTGVDLNSFVGSRIEMVFSSNITNINYGALTSADISVEGSYGLTETSHIESSSLHGAVTRWNDLKKRWEPVTGITISDAGVLTGTVVGAVYN